MRPSSPAMPNRYKAFPQVTQLPAEAERSRAAFNEGLAQAFAFVDKVMYPVVAGFLDELPVLRATQLPAKVNELFNGLIHREQSEIFLALFEAYKTFMQSQVEEGGAPFRSCLSLELPADWKPSHEQALKEVLRKVRADAIEVMPEYNWLPGPDRMLKAVLPPVAASVVIVLLGTGLKDLSITGVLSDAPAVAKALGESALESFTLKSRAASEWPLTPEEIQSGKTLIEGLATCRSLTHLGLRHAGFFSLLEAVDMLVRKDGPTLTSVKLNVNHMSGPCPDHTALVRDLLLVLRQCPSLEVIDIKANVSDVASWKAAIALPLGGSLSLKSLKLRSVGAYPITPENTEALLAVLELAITCPKLKHVDWMGKRTQMRARVVVDMLATRGRDLNIPSSAKRIQAILTDPNLALEFVRLSGWVLSPDHCRGFFKGLAGNTSVRGFNFSGTATELSATTYLMASLAVNTTLDAPVLSPDHRDFYLLGPDGYVYEFDPISCWSEGKGVPFVLSFMGHGASVRVVDRGQALLATLSVHADSLHDRLAYRARRPFLLQHANAELVPHIANFMNAALVSRAPTGNKSDAEQFKPMVPAVLHALVQERRVVEAVRLGAVAPNNAYVDRVPEPASRELRELVDKERGRFQSTTTTANTMATTTTTTTVAGSLGTLPTHGTADAHRRSGQMKISFPTKN